MVANITPIDSERSEVNPATLLKDLKGKPYLGAHEAIYWFTVEHPAPEGRIITTIDFDHKAVRAEVYVGDVLVATGHSIGDGNKSLEKLESAAVRRALANAGYGTIAAMAEVDDEDATKTQARAAIAAKEIPTETAREKMGSGKNRRVDTSKNAPQNGKMVEAPPSPAPEVVDPYADLRSQLEEAGVTTITSIKNITDTRVRIVTKEDYSAMLPGMLASVKLTVAKVGERYFEIEWSGG